MKADLRWGCSLLQSPGDSEEMIPADTGSGLDLSPPPANKAVLAVMTRIKTCHRHSDGSNFAHSSANGFKCSGSPLVMYNESPK